MAWWHDPSIHLCIYSANTHCIVTLPVYAPTYTLHNHIFSESFPWPPGTVHTCILSPWAMFPSHFSTSPCFRPEFSSFSSSGISSMKPFLLSTARCNFPFFCFHSQKNLYLYMVIQYIYLCILNIYWMTPKCNPKTKLSARSTEIKIMKRHPSLGSQPGRRYLLHACYKTESSLMFQLMSCSFLKT